MRPPSIVNVKNRRAGYDYFVLDRYTAGIQLVGTEIKSIRAGHCSLVDTYCMFINGELWVKQMNIAAYAFGTYNNHVPLRDRKLLLNKRELQKLARQTKETGKTIIPLNLFIDENGRAKLTIALCQGKKEYDKRETIKDRDNKRELDRIRRR